MPSILTLSKYPDEERQERFNAQVAEQNKGIEQFQSGSLLLLKMGLPHGGAGVRMRHYVLSGNRKIAHRGLLSRLNLARSPPAGVGPRFLWSSDWESQSLSMTKSARNSRPGLPKRTIGKELPPPANINGMQPFPSSIRTRIMPQTTANIERSLAFSFASKGEFRQGLKGYTKSFAKVRKTDIPTQISLFLLARQRQEGTEPSLN